MAVEEHPRLEARAAYRARQLRVKVADVVLQVSLGSELEIALSAHVKSPVLRPDMVLQQPPLAEFLHAVLALVLRRFMVLPGMFDEILLSGKGQVATRAGEAGDACVYVSVLG